jgi:hypothetical protein
MRGSAPPGGWRSRRCSCTRGLIRSWRPPWRGAPCNLSQSVEAFSWGSKSGFLAASWRHCPSVFLAIAA